MSELKRTPLFDVYGEYGAKTIDFGGWDLPVQFSSIKLEHEAVRTKAGLFDVSHMGEIEVTGKDSLLFLQTMVTNDVTKIHAGKAQYSALCYENGGTVDDIIIYQKGENHYWLVVNAANTEKDFEWLQQHASNFDVKLENQSLQYAQLALQGPLAEEVLQQITENTDLNEIKFFQFKEGVKVSGVDALVSRTGYTGEDGFEIYCNSNDAIKLWRKILEHDDVLPIGLGARDSLRFEAGLPLYGQELTANITPIEAGIGFAVNTNKEVHFFGKDVLSQQKAEGAPRKLVGIEMIDRGIPRHGYPVYIDGQLIGEVTTGTQSPTLKKNIGYALIKRELAELDRIVEVEIRSKKIQARIIKSPFYKRPKKQ
ncbi:glycine cleavage system aminomethyltransferase GcvT [Bacillus sp. JJ722]|uniref:glycine cleavage system aminomethyltransferase GcvT n=1 Tax=Bacillus sp. JJ722 TaxID=3122973 RepID=UPI002FFF5A2B